MDVNQRSNLMEATALSSGVAPPRPDDDDVLVGLRAIADFATAEGFPISHATAQKYCSPAVNSGPEITGYWGFLPTSTKGRVRAWIRSRHTTSRPASRRWPQRTDAQSAP